VTTLADRLQRADRVTRRAHHDDRRLVLVELTERVAREQPEALTRYHAAAGAAASDPAEHRDAVAEYPRRVAVDGQAGHPEADRPPVTAPRARQRPQPAGGVRAGGGDLLRWALAGRAAPRGSSA